jgi:SanA protein
MLKLLRWALGGLAALGVILALPRLYTALKYTPQIKVVTDAPERRVAIVFGAGLRRDGRPTAVLYDRVLTAVQLYQQGKVHKLLMSGDNRFENYNEPASMKQAAVELGVPEQDIVLDYAGQRTYDTCYRARHIFGLQEAVLVTQNFHLPRALFLCEALGLSAVGISADQRTYLRGSQLVWNVREVMATAAALWDVLIARPTPILGEPIAID